MRSLRARDDVPSQSTTEGNGHKRKSFLKATIMAAGILAASAALLHNIGKEGMAGKDPADSPRHQWQAPNKPGIPAHRTKGTAPSPLPELHPAVPTQDARQSNILGTLSTEFPYAALDCQMLPAAEADGVLRGKSFFNMGREYSVQGPFLALETDGGMSQGMRVSLTALKGLYRRDDAWGVLAVVQYLESLNLESPASTLYDEYSQMWLEGGQDRAFPDPVCMERIAGVISLLHMARHDLSELLGNDPSLASEVLGSLPESARRIVLSGAVGVSLADPGRPNIEGLFGFLPLGDKIALIEMYDASLPENERLPELMDGSSLLLPEAELWNLFSERMRRFNSLAAESRP